jgi:NitT/TauT family transport system permease protein
MRKLALPAMSQRTSFNYADALVLLGVATLIYGGVRLAFGAPAAIRGPEITLAPAALPRYTLLSVARMSVAYVLSLIFSLIYGYAAAHSRSAEKVLLPVLDVLQSIPILSFLPVVLLSLSALLPEAWAAEMASVTLILTSQVWNMTFSFYQSLTTIPTELHEAADVFRLSRWLRFRQLEVPFATIGLIWNSMMSWAGGWFFLMAAETFVVGARDFRLPGLGSYLYEAANRGNMQAVLWGLGALVGTIVLVDLLIWRPVLVWGNRFKLETVKGEEEVGSWVYDLLERSTLVSRVQERLAGPVSEALDDLLLRPARPRSANRAGRSSRALAAARYLALGPAAALLLYAGVHAAQLLYALPLASWGQLGLGLLATMARVTVALLIAVAWTLPLGVAIGTNQRLATILQPVVQMVASIPATALFPVVLLFFLRLPGGLNLAAILLMLMGTQWYALFNIIAGAAAIPEDLRYTTRILRLGRAERWRTLILPALLPYLITGMITASGGAWNASIVAEYVTFGGEVHETTGLGALIARATNSGDFALLFGATLSMVLAVALINRFFWRRLYAYAAERCRME